MENNQRSSSNPHLAKPVLCDGFLIPMTDFVNNVGNMENYPSHEKALSWIYNYATFLKQPLKLEMFVPCDEGGNIIPIPKSEDVPDMPPDLQAEYWYSWESDFNKAKDALLIVVNGPFKLVNYADLFDYTKPNTKEAIFEWQFDPQTNPNQLQFQLGSRAAQNSFGGDGCYFAWLGEQLARPHGCAGCSFSA